MRPSNSPFVEADKYLHYDYEANIDFQNENVFQLETQYGYNITFDASFLVKGQGERGFFVMNNSQDNYSPHIDRNFIRDLVVFSLTSNTSIINASEVLGTPICNRTDQNRIYSHWRSSFEMYNLSFYGYSYVQSPADNFIIPDQDFSNFTQVNYGLSDQCDIYAREILNIELYDPTEPSRGFTMIYGGGDKFRYTEVYSKGTEISFICDENENIEDATQLNELFATQGTARLISTQQIFEPDTLKIEIYTKGACPARCQTYVNDTDSLLQLCNGNGICAHDEKLNNVRCFCDVERLMSDEFYCVLNSSSIDPFPVSTVCAIIFHLISQVCLHLRNNNIHTDIQSD